MSISTWTLYVSSETLPFVCFVNPITSRDGGPQYTEQTRIVKAKSMMSGNCWKFYSNIHGKCPFTFILTDKVRYASWPDDILSIGMIYAFLADHKVLVVH